MTTPKQPRQTTRVMQAVTAAHAKPSMFPRYVVGTLLLLVGLGLFVWHVVQHQDAERSTSEFRAIEACAALGLIILPGFPEGIAAGIASVGGALLGLKKQKDGAP